MSDVAKQTLGVLRRITEFLDYLPQEQVDDLAEGRARLALIPWGANEPAVPAARKPARAAKAAPSVDVESVRGALAVAASREEAAVVLAPFKVAELREIAGALGIGGVSGTPKAALARQLVDFTVGARLSGAAIRAM